MIINVNVLELASEPAIFSPFACIYSTNASAEDII